MTICLEKNDFTGAARLLAGSVYMIPQRTLTSSLVSLCKMRHMKCYYCLGEINGLYFFKNLNTYKQKMWMEQDRGNKRLGYFWRVGGDAMWCDGSHQA